MLISNLGQLTYTDTSYVPTAPNSEKPGMDTSAGTRQVPTASAFS